MSKDLLESGAYAVAIVSALLAGVTFLLTQTVVAFREWRKKRALHTRLALGGYGEQQLIRALRNYIPPKCQQIDPSGHEESRGLAVVQESLFSTLDRELDQPLDVRHLIVLADSGMGKTSAVLNYCARHLSSRRSRKFAVRVVHLGSPGANESIVATPDKYRCVLFLDALDEDLRAVEDHHLRLGEILSLGREFRGVVVTCRTQFFSRDEEIPRETGVIKRGPRAAGEGAEYIFHKLYLSPFTDSDVHRYLRRRYPIWRLLRRMKAREMVKQIPHLTARPMLLAHIDDLVGRREQYRYSFELYAEMVDAWVERESGLVNAPEALLTFSKRMAVDIYINREHRGAERIPTYEITLLAREWGIKLDSKILTGRSLLNRDAEGYYKFAHRSIMEHLFVQAAIASAELKDVVWTDQMLQFLYERLQAEKRSGYGHSAILTRNAFLGQLIEYISRINGFTDILCDCLIAWLVDMDEHIQVSVGISIHDLERFPTTQGSYTSISWSEYGKPYELMGSPELRQIHVPAFRGKYPLTIHVVGASARDTVVERMSELFKIFGVEFVLSGTTTMQSMHVIQSSEPL